MLVLGTALRRGERVVVENPTAPRVLDILAHLGLEMIGVACDEMGPLPDSLQAALARRPSALLIQSRAQEPAGSALTTDRASDLAKLIAPHDILVIEDDGKAELSTVPAASLGQYLDRRTVLVRSFNKSHGVDLRVAVVAGPAATLDLARERHVLGQGWTSYLLQRALAHMLGNSDDQVTIRNARETYRHRRERLQAALAARGIETFNRDGLAVWIPVRNESAAMMRLALDGISVSPGRRFMIRRSLGDHIRVVASAELPNLDAVADSLANASAHDASPSPI
jgi:DNA-binding transcriptional MocR family regulator